MPKTVEYIGTATRWPELAITGKQSVWFPGQAEERADNEAGALLATGFFKIPDDTLTPDDIAKTKALVSGGGNSALITSSGYHFAGNAISHPNTAAAWYDRSGQGNDAAFQAGLTAAGVWATAGVCTIPNPTGTTGYMQLPPLNFDYAAGESFLLFWRGTATPEGADMPLLGDTGNNTNSTQSSGISVACKTDGKVTFQMRDAAGTLFSGGNSTATVFSATVETSWAVVVDGVARTYRYFINGALDVAEQAFAAGASVNTVSGRAFNIGGNGRVVSSNQEGVAQKNINLHIIRRAAGLGVPADIATTVMNLHRNPQRLVTAAEF